MTSTKALRYELGWSRARMDRFLRALHEITQAPNPRTWPRLLAAWEADLLRAANDEGIWPRHLRLLDDSRTLAKMRQATRHDASSVEAMVFVTVGEDGVSMVAEL